MKPLHIFAALIAAICFVAAQTVFAAPQKNTGATAIHMEKQTDSGPLARKTATLIELTATIEMLNLEKRMLTIKTPAGETKTFNVSPKVTRLSEFKPGDKIVVELYESLAFEVREPTPEELKSPRTIISGVGKHTKALPPGMEAGMVSHTIVTIEAINMETNMVTIKLPEGNSVTIKAQRPENLKRVKVGDTVAVTWAEAIAMTLNHHKG